MDENNNIRRLPGDRCMYFRMGRCLYEEMANPGYHERFRCSMLSNLENAYDDFLDRAEAFNLDEELAGRIWQTFLERFVRTGIDCPDYVPGEWEGVAGCALALGFLCLKALPECEGQCSRFRTPSRGVRDGRNDDNI
ncbi:hypothetical protein GGQ74_000282 [Desulfobaculum xiamenense]|uniref:Uncharacterized protein n=1 Tax=Desulfobaculum xiamenense TaxID=995050 RepID=A0A846QJI7_9BACT|nr:hypothetical protein [Desulfobaculum xiamenense]